MNVVITGATGYIGRSLLQEIEHAEQIDRVYCLVRDATSLLSCLSNKCIVQCCDLNTITEIEKIQADVCIHLAGVTNENDTGSKECLQTNVHGTANVVAFCKKNAIPKLVFLSSVNVYLSEKGVYASSKLAAESIIIQSGLNYVILRSALVYGPGCKQIDKIINCIRRFHVVPLLKKGSGKEQPIYIWDLARQILSHTVSFESNQILNLYGKTALSYKDMVRTIASVIEKKVFFLNLPLKPIRWSVCILQKMHIHPLITPEQIAHMCEDLQTSDEKFAYDPEELYNNLRNYLIT